MVCWNMVIWAGVVFGLGVKRLFFGGLRSIEYEVCLSGFFFHVGRWSLVVGRLSLVVGRWPLVVGSWVGAGTGIGRFMALLRMDRGQIAMNDGLFGFL